MARGHLGAPGYLQIGGGSRIALVWVAGASLIPELTG